MSVTRRQIYKNRAEDYAEKHCISDYRIKGCKMIYNVSYRESAKSIRYTVQHEVDLNTMLEDIPRTLGRYDAAGELNNKDYMQN